MSPSFAPMPSTSTDLQRLHNTAGPSKQSSTPTDGGLLSPYAVHQPYSHSDSPSSFTSPADLTSNGGYSDFTDFNPSDDPYYGVDFDAGENPAAVDTNILDLSLPATSVPIEAYLPHPHSDTAPSTETLTNNTYSVSPNHSTTTNTSHQRNGSYEPSVATKPFYGQATQDIGSDPSELNGSDHLFPTASALHPRSSEEVSTANMNSQDGRPTVTVTPWGLHDQHENEPSNTQLGTFGEHMNQDYEDMDAAGSPDHQMGNTPAANIPDYRLFEAPSTPNHQEFPGSDDHGGRIGVPPEGRTDTTIPSLKDQAREEELEAKVALVEEWRSQGGSSTDTDDGFEQRQSNLGLPVNTRQRARSQGAVSGRGFIDPHMIAPRTSTRDPEEGKYIEPVSDLESIHENQLQDGQTYFNLNANRINEGDWNATIQSRHWNDAPMYPYAINTQSQAPTAQEAIKRFNELADNQSLLSRTATWGTRRRRSAPSIAEIESINDGSFLKRLAIKDTKRPGPSGYFKDSLEQLTSLVRKKSDGGKLKRKQSDNRGRSDGNRKESQSSLAPPMGRSPSSDRRRPASPRVDTSVGATYGQVHTRNGSLSATSPMGPLNNFIGNIRRSRSGSNIAGIWAESGGPPVPTLPQQSSLPEEVIPDNEHIKLENSDLEAEEEEDEDLHEDGEKIDFVQSAIPIIATFPGFQEHVKRVNPNMESTYLVDRIAHQQVVRYKALLNWRVKHQAAIMTGCTSGPHCIRQGGAATLFDANGHPRDAPLSANGLNIDMCDGDSSPEGALAAENFPPGVPLPPASTLPAEFECQLCFKVKKFTKPSDWTKHVHEDVQPFTCTYSSCREPKSFKRKADWVRHENERHRHLEWWTCDVDDCTHKCYRKDNFLQHLVREHKLPEPKVKTKAAAKKAPRGGPDDQVWIRVRTCHHDTTTRPQEEPCKFCGKVLTSWKKLTVHLAKHMEHISLPVLELVNQQVIDANTIISPVGPAPVPKLPMSVTPTEQKHHPGTPLQYGNMNANVSPGGYQVGNYPSPYDGTSPNIQGLQQFPPSGIFPREMGYNHSTVNHGTPFTSAAHSNHGIMYDTTPLGFATYEPMSANSNPNSQPRGFGSMDHSPHIDQAQDFNHHLTSPVPPQSHYSYPSSHHPSSHPSVSPDPSQQQMSAFPGQSMGPDPSFAPGQQFQSHQNQMMGMGDDQYNNYQPINNNQNFTQVRANQGNQATYQQQQRQQRQMGRGQGQGQIPYPATSQSGYYPQYQG